ncbi:hypothetical protein DL771_007319 [Monosporascus sp. 5C6A]|nr:hypothetical protein DL771_007319 [Monosporascus sp. 5C6A]
MAASAYVGNTKFCTTLALPETWTPSTCWATPTIGVLPSVAECPALLPACLGFKITAFLVLVAILYVAKAKLKDAFTLVNVFVSMDPAFPYFLVLANQGHAVPWSLRTAQAHAGDYHCAMQSRSHTQLRVGTDGSIPRWRKGSTVKYIVRAESFPTSDMATYTAGKLAEAISMWKDKGVRFQQVYPTCKATFQVIYHDMAADNSASVCAESFFPNQPLATKRTLIVYGPALNEDNRGYLANILAHEIGHIMGLRHEFAAKRNSGETGSVLLGKENGSSIMNYFDHPSKLHVQKQDLDDLKSFYESTEKKHEELVIREFEPPLLFYR